MKIQKCCAKNEVSKTFFRSTARLTLPLSLLFFVSMHPFAIASVHSPSRVAIPPDTTGWLAIEQMARETKTTKYDPYYKKGKEAFLGKGDHQSYNFCVPAPVSKHAESESPERVPLKRKSIKQFRKATVVEFVGKLYDCENPKEWVLNYFDKQTAGYIVYYLNKRFKLKLQQ